MASKQANAVVVLKGPDTVIASPDGRVCVNTKTTRELAVIGSGDVLSGIIVSLIGEGKMNTFDAACAGVWIHSQAAINQGRGLIAEDIIRGIPSVLDDLYKANKE
jgi:NAD(P)H-hydrate repair Nnr-like enzyme with NAD(P)H-hydrate dehydratase domain